MPEANIEVRLAREADYESCCAFHNRFYPPGRRLEQWRWAFADTLMPTDPTPFAGALGVREWHVNDHPFDQLKRKIAREVGFYNLNGGLSVVVLSPDGGQPIDETRFTDWYITGAYQEGRG